MTTPNSANPMVAAKSHLSGYSFLAMTKTAVQSPKSEVQSLTRLLQLSISCPSSTLQRTTLDFGSQTLDRIPEDASTLLKACKHIETGAGGSQQNCVARLCRCE